jgi:hypothetical protein
VTDNRFVNNDEGIGLGVKGWTVTDNYFANNTPHVKDYTTAEADHYNLQTIIDTNEFDEPVKVDTTNREIVDQS